MSKAVGELNGPWALLLKVALVCVPVFIPLILLEQAWVVSQIMEVREFRAACEANSYTARDALTDKEARSVEHHDIWRAILKEQTHQ